MMGRKHTSTAIPFLGIWIIFVFEFPGILAETCKKIDNCSCRKSNGKIISLRAIDGGSKGPAFRDIPSVYPSSASDVFDWNPCTKFSKGDGCKDTLMCAAYGNYTFPCADTVTDFIVESDGTITIAYQPTYDSRPPPAERALNITLTCDETKYPGETDGVYAFYRPFTGYVFFWMSFKSRCACDDGCAPSNPLNGLPDQSHN